MLWNILNSLGFFLGRIEKVLSKATFKISLRWPLNTGLTVEDYKIYDNYNSKSFLYKLIEILQIELTSIEEENGFDVDFDRKH